VQSSRAYRAAILPTFLHSRPNPKFNPKTKPNTNPIDADATYTELQASIVTQIVCACHFVQKLGQVQHTNNNKSTTYPQLVLQQIHNKLYKWSLGFIVNGRTFRVITVSPTYRMAHITSPHRWRTRQAVYTISKDVRHSLTSLIGTVRRDRVDSAPPHPASPSLPF